MSQFITAAALIAATPVSTKVLRERFGVRKTPLIVSPKAKAYKRDMPFDEEHAGKITTNSWVVVDPALKSTGLEGVTLDGTVVRANTYNGNLGARSDYLSPNYLREIPPVDSKDHKKMLKGYSECSIEEVPFVVVSGDAPSTDEDASEEV